MRTMIKIDLSSKVIEEIKQKHNHDVFKNTFEDIKTHLEDLRNNKKYKKFTDLFVSSVCESISEEKVATLLCLDSKEKMENFVETVEKAIEKDSNSTGKTVDEIKKVILGDTKGGFLRFYTTFSNRNWAFEFLKLLKCNVCPYCNRIYTFSVNGKNKCKPEFDHYYPKNEYPYLSISVFNLVPSCSFCNKGKSNKCVNNAYKHKLIYPYEESFEDENLKIKFSIESDTLDYLYGDFSEVEIKIQSKNIQTEDLIKDYNSYFKINSLYTQHTDYVEEIISNAIIYNDSMTKELLERYSDMFSTQEEILRMVFGNYVDPKDFSKRPLSKLTHDLLKELEVYK